jgi:hypothetical protein
MVYTSADILHSDAGKSGYGGAGKLTHAALSFSVT